MSNYQAIGGVSTTLRTLLKHRMELPAGVNRSSFHVTIGPPKGDEDTKSETRINLYLYRVSECPYLKNQDIFDLGNPGAYGNPPLSLDLHYIVTAFGATSEEPYKNETRAHFLLGSAMRILHDHPVISRDFRTSEDQPILHESLRNSYEQLKVQLDLLNLEDITKIFTALELPYQLSASYKISVIQIESKKQRRFPRPVGEPPLQGPRILVYPLSLPRINEINVRRADDPLNIQRAYPYARKGDTLIVLGYGLDGDGTRIIVDSEEISITSRETGKLEFVVPDEGFFPGIHTVIVKSRLPGSSDDTLIGMASNQGLFMLVPRIREIDLSTSPGSIIVTGSGFSSGKSDSVALLGEHVLPENEWDENSDARIRFTIPAGLHGEIPLRIRVNGFENIEPVGIDFL